MEPGAGMSCRFSILRAVPLTKYEPHGRWGSRENRNENDGGARSLCPPLRGSTRMVETRPATAGRQAALVRRMGPAGERTDDPKLHRPGRGGTLVRQSAEAPLVSLQTDQGRPQRCP